MSILSGLILEDVENLFRNFWTPFSIFLIVFLRVMLKKEVTALPGRVRHGHCAWAAFKGQRLPRAETLAAALPRLETRAADPPPRRSRR